MKKIMAFVLSLVMICSISLLPAVTIASTPVKDDPTLDEAMNIEGGSLTFESEGDYPWIVETDYLGNTYGRSSNNGVDSSISAVSTTVQMQEGEFLWFDYLVRSEEGYDFFYFYVNGVEEESWSGYMQNFSTYRYTAPEAGEYTFTWALIKDEAYHYYSMDYVAVNQVEAAMPVRVTGITAQEEMTLASGMKNKVQYAVEPANAFNPQVAFSSSDATVATVDFRGVVTAVAEGTATITVTTSDGGFTADCVVTVDDGIVHTDFYAYVQYDALGDSNYWCSFSDINTSYMEYEAGDYNPSISPRSGEFVNGLIYGFNSPGGADYYASFYIHDPYTGITTYPGGNANGQLVEDLAYDYSSDIMYAIVRDGGSNNRKLARVDLTNGHLADIAMLDTLDLNYWGFAIDLDGTAYVLIAGVDIYDRTDTGKLCTLDLATGECTLIGDTGVVLYFAQGLAFDYERDMLYWFNSYETTNGLYVLDKTTGEVVNNCGMLMNGLTLQFITIPNEIEADPFAANIAVSFVDGITGDEVWSMMVASGYELTSDDFPSLPSYSDHTFKYWDHDGSPIYNNTVITAVFHDYNDYGWFFETRDEVDAWALTDADGDGHEWSWSRDYMSGYIDAYDGIGCIISETYAENTSEYLTPDNWIISPNITIPADAEGARLSFQYMAYGSSYENFGVYISTDGGTTWLPETAYFTAARNTWNKATIALDDYIGSSIRIAFRHYNTMYTRILSIDTVEVIVDGDTTQLGDVNGDNAVTSADALLVLRYALSLIEGSLLNVDIADMNGDGDVTTADALEILRVAMSIG